MRSRRLESHAIAPLGLGAKSQTPSAVIASISRSTGALLSNGPEGQRCGRQRRTSASIPRTALAWCAQAPQAPATVTRRVTAYGPKHCTCYGATERVEADRRFGRVVLAGQQSDCQFALSLSQGYPLAEDRGSATPVRWWARWTTFCTRQCTSGAWLDRVAASSIAVRQVPHGVEWTACARRFSTSASRRRSCRNIRRLRTSPSATPVGDQLGQWPRART